MRLISLTGVLPAVAADFSTSFEDSEALKPFPSRVELIKWLAENDPSKKEN